MKKEMNKYFSIGVLILLVFISYKIISPFLIVLISAFILAYLVKPIYDWLSKYLHKKISAFICILIILLIIIVPLAGIVGGLLNQAKNVVISPEFQNILQGITKYPVLEKLEIYFPLLLEKGTNMVISLLSSALSYLPSLFLTIVLLTLSMYYFLVDWDIFSKDLKKYIPEKNKEKTVEEISDTTRAIVYGMFLVALIQFVVAAIGFYLIGIKFYFLLPSIIFFLAFIPSVGPAFVWVPLALYYILVGNWTTAIILIIFGLILSYFFDAFLRARIFGSRAKVNPLLMLIGILGGIYLFGIFGFIIGPLILIYTIKLVNKFLEGD